MTAVGVEPKTSGNNAAIRPFHVEIPDEALEDLRRRIADARLPSKELVDGSVAGRAARDDPGARALLADRVRLARVRGEAERAAAVQDRDRRGGHPLHPREVAHENALPLIITHGWPGSVIEMLETVGPLTDPTAHGGQAEDAFHLVLPSLPGYGFSAAPSELGWDAGRFAQAWGKLMPRLGYTRYVAQGGDVGAIVTDAMGRQAPEGLIGIHTNLFVPGSAGFPTNTEEERAAVEQDATSRKTGFGYFIEQATRPQTIGYALLDSPIALAAWMLDHDTDSLLQDLERIRRRQAVGQSDPRPHPRQRHAVLADRHRGLGGAVVLGKRTGRRSCGRTRCAASQGPGRIHPVPRRARPDPAQLGRAGLPHPHLLQQGRQGRPLRRLGRARTVLDRDPRHVPVAPLARSAEPVAPFERSRPTASVASRPCPSCKQLGGGWAPEVVLLIWRRTDHDAAVGPIGD